MNDHLVVLASQSRCCRSDRKTSSGFAASRRGLEPPKNVEALSCELNGENSLLTSD